MWFPHQSDAIKLYEDIKCLLRLEIKWDKAAEDMTRYLLGLNPNKQQWLRARSNQWWVVQSMVSCLFSPFSPLFHLESKQKSTMKIFDKHVYCCCFSQQVSLRKTEINLHVQAATANLVGFVFPENRKWGVISCDSKDVFCLSVVHSPTIACSARSQRLEWVTDMSREHTRCSWLQDW